MDTKIDIGVKYADKQARQFDEEKIKAGQCVIGLQVTVSAYTFSVFAETDISFISKLNLHVYSRELSDVSLRGHLSVLSSDGNKQVCQSGWNDSIWNQKTSV